MKEASFYKKLKNKKVQCQLCPRCCVIKAGSRGNCGVRANIKGRLYSLVYGKPCTAEIDPIEKKPLFHFLPGTTAYSIATAGCNLHCQYCFTPDTIVTTNKGISNIRDLFDSAYKTQNEHIAKPFSEIFALGHNGKKTRILKLFRHNYSGNILKIKPFYLPEIKCTPYHKIFVFSEGKIRKKEAKDINHKDYLLVPKKSENEKVIQIDAKEILKKVELRVKRWERKITPQKAKEILTLSGKLTSKQLGKRYGIHSTYLRKLRCDLRKKGFVELFQPKERINEKVDRIKFTHGKKWIERYFKLNEKLGALLGYYCAEGSVIKQKSRPTSYSLLFSFGKHEKSLAKKTVDLLEEIFNVRAKKSYGMTGINVCVFNTLLAVLFKSLAGSGAKNKKVPEEIIDSTDKIKKAFLLAYFEGDGWIDKEIISINTVSKDLAFGIYWLLLKLGYLPNFYKWAPSKKKIIEGRKVTQSALYYVKLRMAKFGKKIIDPNIFYHLEKSHVKFKENKNYFFVPVFKIEKKMYKGHVYNLEVEKNHSYLANFVGVGNCQNWEISQAKPEDVPSLDLPPERIVEEAKRNNCESISYTYTDPAIVAIEYILDTAKLARKKGIKNIAVSNGFINAEPRAEQCRLIDGANIDLKGDDQFYRKFTGAWLEPVHQSIVDYKKRGVWIEVTNLIIPTLNDKPAQIRELIRWVKDNVGLEVPLHFTAFYPAYKMLNIPPTTIETLRKAREMALRAGLVYVYTGNLPDEEGLATYCPECKKPVIKRRGFSVIENNLVRGRCKFCNAKIAGVWS